ncbi:hypothetical protein C8R43DRAFT_1245210 [Mycena crocata]|nr:hypothetical protein C8R43DRAFT_1245210 [Mycena crocata]
MTSRLCPALRRRPRFLVSETSLLAPALVPRRLESAPTRSPAAQTTYTRRATESSLPSRPKSALSLPSAPRPAPAYSPRRLSSDVLPTATCSPFRSSRSLARVLKRRAPASPHLPVTRGLGAGSPSGVTKRGIEAINPRVTRVDQRKIGRTDIFLRRTNRDQKQRLNSAVKAASRNSHKDSPQMRRIDAGKL